MSGKVTFDTDEALTIRRHLLTLAPRNPVEAGFIQDVVFRIQENAARGFGIDLSVKQGQWVLGLLGRKR